ncbi:MAG TPA: NUDIX domain-containing protein [Candidatus Saccharimonadales bacterium]|nr:NUDIX domain-containing protein [Candidatus Saccharimonadales bacterium]
MVKLSAGLLLYRSMDHGIEVLLVHPGGPFWAGKEDGVWSLPKGEYNKAEEPHAAAKREFTEETGFAIPEGDLLPLGEVTYGNKKVVAWAIEGDADVAQLKSNLITIDWPPKSGKTMEIPECDRAEWFDLATAEMKLVKGQVPFIQALAKVLHVEAPKMAPPEDGKQLSLL